MKGSFTVTALFAALLASGCSQTASPTGPSSASSSLSVARSAGSNGMPGSSNSQSVPFNGTFEGTQAATPLEPPFALVDGTASGTATQLGRFTVAFPHTVNFATATGVGTYTFIAANGDTLTADFTGQAQVAPITSIVEQATITGGTGRFTGATGNFTVRRLVDRVAGTTTGSFEGTMSAPGAGNQ
jgi:hypothetical protein